MSDLNGIGLGLSGSSFNAKAAIEKNAGKSRTS